MTINPSDTNSNHKKNIIVLVGPTAIGKTGLAINLAKYFDTHIFSADSRQFYRELKIGTAAPTEAESKLAKHFFAGNLSIHDSTNVSRYENDVLKLAEKLFIKKDFIVVDGSPGIGCPVVSSLSGANFVVLVTEPSISGLHDLKRVYELVKKFKIKAGCIINKFDINKKVTEEIIEFLKEEDIVHISNLVYDESFTKAMTIGKTIVEYNNSNLTKVLIESWDKIKGEIL